MNAFTEIDFGPDDVRAVVAGKEPVARRVVISVLTSMTCGEPCWHAVEDICRCSCGGKNHGCLTTADGKQPVRASKIDGERYKLAGVGLRADLMAAAKELNGRQWRSVCPAQAVIGCEVGDFTEAQIADARARGINVWFSQYKYAWNETDAGAPARLKYATKEQVAKWPELKAWQGHERVRDVCLLWQIETMPPAPTIAVVNKETGEPI
jgi:hypothetical protein